MRIFFLLLFFVGGCVSPRPPQYPEQVQVKSFMLTQPCTLESILDDFKAYEDKINPDNIIYVISKLHRFSTDATMPNWDAFYAYTDLQLNTYRDFFIDEDYDYPLTTEESSMCRTIMKYHMTVCDRRGMSPTDGVYYLELLIKSLKIRIGKNTKEDRNWFKTDKFQNY